MACGWDEHEGELVKTVRKADFAEALAYVNEVGRLADEVDHHPDIEISWNRVTLRLSTHSERRITDKDHDLAARIDLLT